ncbi:hypothetical protein GCM10010347_30030 [Streptomyces cirratus]|uniref:Transposase n=1 Tax=Streptomyces cirratus TaxID=68187 RepID=A0ABQ3ESK2_9ACTN|nr:hypothetical protein GCM10010347_30030 [Streptomyces cirratus]
MLWGEVHSQVRSAEHAIEVGTKWLRDYCADSGLKASTWKTSALAFRMTREQP